MPARSCFRPLARAAAVGTSFLVTAGLAVAGAPAASATPVCTDGYKGGAPRAVCGNRVFPEAALSRAYVQYTPDARGFSEYTHGLEYLAQLYPRWVSVFTLDGPQGVNDPKAVTAGPDRKRSTDPTDTGDGRKILVAKVTDHTVPDAGKETLAFSLSVHGNEGGGLEGGLRTIEDLAAAATRDGAEDVLVDGVPNYTSNTGKPAEFRTHRVRNVLAKEAVYFIDFNMDGRAAGDLTATPPGLFTRGNSIGTDLNRQMPTVGRINSSRNPFEESETKYGFDLLQRIADESPGGKMAYGADVHGELTSRAYVDIMYPAGEFDSVKHRQLMAIAERTKSVIDATLYEGIQNEIEEATGGNEGHGVEDVAGAPKNAIPTMPAHWATVWDTLGYTDTGFIGDYLATDLAVTGMDYEIFLNHTVPEKVWNVYLQENHINASRAIIKTAMAYALTQNEEFNDDNVKVETVGQAGYVVNPVRVTDTDANGPGRRPGPQGNGIGQNGKPVAQASYDVTNQKWFTDTSRLMGDKPFRGVTAHDVANGTPAFRALDTLVLADIALPQDPQGRSVDEAAYYGNLKEWVTDGGNLVLTDRALHALGKLDLVPAAAVTDVKVYQPYVDISDFSHPLVKGLRKNARQFVEAAALGYGIGNTASPQTVVTRAAFQTAGGRVVGTTGTDRVSLGEVPVGKGVVRVLGGALPMPTEENDHRYGLRNYALTYSGLFAMENAVTWRKGGLPAAGGTAGEQAPGTAYAPLLGLLGLVLPVSALAVRRRRSARLAA